MSIWQKCSWNIQLETLYLLYICNFKFFVYQWFSYLSNDENAHEYYFYYIHSSGVTYATLDYPLEHEYFYIHEEYKKNQTSGVLIYLLFYAFRKLSSLWQDGDISKKTYLIQINYHNFSIGG